MIQKLRPNQKLAIIVKIQQGGQLALHLVLARTIAEALDIIQHSNPMLNVVGVDVLNADFIYVDTDDQGQIILDGPSRLLAKGN